MQVFWTKRSKGVIENRSRLAKKKMIIFHQDNARPCTGVIGMQKLMNYDLICSHYLIRQT